MTFWWNCAFQVPDGATMALVLTKYHLHDSHDYMPGESEYFSHKCNKCSYIHDLWPTHMHIFLTDNKSKWTGNDTVSLCIMLWFTGGVMELHFSVAHPIRDPSTRWWRGGRSETLASGEGQRGVRTAKAQERQCKRAGRWASQGNPWDLPHTTAIHEGKNVSQIIPVMLWIIFTI